MKQKKIIVLMFAVLILCIILGGVFLFYREDNKDISFNTTENNTENNTDIIYETGPKTIIVSQDNTGNYTTINEAINNAAGGDTILIYSGVYDEVIVIPDNNVSLVGVDKDTCIIRNTTGIYKNAPIYAYGNFTLENLTVKMTLENVGNWYPTYDTNNVHDTYAGYAIHIDHLNENEDGTIHNAKIINCNFYSEAFPAAGLGVNNNQCIEFINCTFTRNTENDIYFKDNLKCAFFAHTSNYECISEKLILNNCKITSKCGYAAKFLMTLTGEKEAEITAIDNTFWSDELQTGDCVEYIKGESKLNENSKGNSAQCLNIQ